MFINNKYEIEDIVFLKTDIEQMERMIVEIEVLPNQHLLYKLSCGTQFTTHYECELSKDRVQNKSIAGFKASE